MPDQTPAEAAVARGMALLDAKVPGWEERVDVDTLNVVSGYQCPCTQATGKGNYGDALKALRLTRASLEKERSLGFFPAYSGDTKHYSNIPELNAAWRSAILARRAARQEPPDA